MGFCSADFGAGLARFEAVVAAHLTPVDLDNDAVAASEMGIFLTVGRSARYWESDEHEKIDQKKNFEFDNFDNKAIGVKEPYQLCHYIRLPFLV